jgi:hypothetical protein
MLELNDAQKAAVKKWVAEGASLSDVQNRLIKEFGLRPTFIDVRLLVLDLGAAVQDKKPVKDLKDSLAKPSAAAPGDEDADAPLPGEEEDAPAPPMPGQPPAGGGSVKVEVDRLIKPGALVSGSVVFSDGVKAQWSLDHSGRLGLGGTKPGYRPGPSDIQEFQAALQRELAKQGY